MKYCAARYLVALRTNVVEHFNLDFANVIMRTDAAISIAILIGIIVNQADCHRPKYRCSRCRSETLYRVPFAYITNHVGEKSERRVRLNIHYFDHAVCEEEGNFAHPLGDCHRYLRCHKENSKVKIVQCRPGKAFDPFSRTCEDELDARDCKACNKPQGYKIPHEKGGSKFYMCQDGAAYEFACNGDVKFNRHTRSCGNSEANIDPRDTDDTYVPGSVMIQSENGKRRFTTGIKFNKNVHKPIKKDFHFI